jgi:hypothetical protein
MLVPHRYLNHQYTRLQGRYLSLTHTDSLADFFPSLFAAILLVPRNCQVLLEKCRWVEGGCLMEECR